jgi:hypothetical protein
MLQQRGIKRSELKKLAEAAKEERMKLDCGKKDYKGVRKPSCNGGSGCEACNKIYQERQAAK